MTNIIQKLTQDQLSAKHGEFFFANFLTVNGQLRKGPVFVLTNPSDFNDDVIVCSCTGQPAKSQYDVKVHLKRDTYIRTNKIYTIRRTQLLFKIPHTLMTAEQYLNIIQKIKHALYIDQQQYAINI